MDYKKRTQNVINLMQEQGADWFFVQSLFNIRYLSGYSGSHAYLLISPDKQIIVTDGRYQEQIKSEVAPFYEAAIEDKKKDLDLFAEVIGDVSGKTIWFESDHCSFARYVTMQDKIDAGAWEGKSRLVEDLRLIKDADEIAIMRRALKIAEDAWQKTLPQINEGMTERGVAHLIEDEMWKAGAEKESFETLLQFGVRSSLPHGKPSNAKLTKGTQVLMDFGCTIDGYLSDITRTVSFGEPPEQFKTIYDVVREANETAVANIKAGVHCKEADQFARGVIDKAGYGDYFIHTLGHGLGVEIHEAPRLSGKSEFTLQSGFCVTVEPGIYIEGEGGCRIEDTIVVTESGCEVLNETGHDMVVL